ncbi:MAG: hypothetical protein M3112_12010 [Actinomycetia bacterium]|nr:hypothetical protein [Actinomycetes bacterium]
MNATFIEKRIYAISDRLSRANPVGCRQVYEILVDLANLSLDSAIGRIGASRTDERMHGPGWSRTARPFKAAPIRGL